ncbi:MAG: class I SAM-dependent methyltransferase, partial [Dorea sp.]|nr:class I SAM-dependent methyltransferase [Dorea sp.]
MTKRCCPLCNTCNSIPIEQIHMSVPADYHLPSSYCIVSCENCGFVYADTAAAMDDYDYYYTHCNFYGDDSKDDNNYRYDSVAGFLEKYVSRDANLLECGAGNGRFIRALKQHGYTHLSAADPSEESISRMQEAGVQAYISNVYSEVLPDEYEKYDAVFLFEVAEHLLFPRKGIANLQAMLKPNGLFFISVPDYSQIGEDPSPIPNHFNLEHINYFSEKSLDYLMVQHGMERVDQKHEGMTLIQIYQKTGLKPLQIKDNSTAYAIQKYLKRQNCQREELNKVIEALRDKKCELAVWGTGSYVMSLFATTDLQQCNIKCFIDNNKIKQGRKMYN